MDVAAEICIICLGELSTGDVASVDPDSTKSVEDADDVVVPSRKRRQKSPINHADLIANLRPCNHYLHDECIKQWIDKANSCPICRSAFNVIELSAHLQGPILDSYSVQDKQQVQEIDPSAFVGEPEPVEWVPCMICGVTTGDPDEVLLICDNCEDYCHVFCAGLDEVPDGYFVCINCKTDGVTEEDIARRNEDHLITEPDVQPTTRNRRGRRGSRGASLRERTSNNRQRRENAEWASVWQAVLDRANFDLDSPYTEHRSIPRSRQARQDAEQQMEDAWLLRLQIAEQQGAGFDFEESTRRLLPRHQPIETEEEQQAWRAFDRARAAVADPEGARKRKRKSRTPTPHHDENQPQRRFKRPRTGRVPQNEQRNGESSSSARASRRQAEPDAATEGTGPSSTFLQALLGEVEGGPSAAASSPSEYFSDQFGQRTASMSPVASPGSPYLSNPATPRSLSPPPALMSPSSRLSSPPLSPPPHPAHAPPTFSPAVSIMSPGSDDEAERRRSRQRPAASSPPRSRSARQSPSRPASTVLSYEHKTEVQKMVSEALKPHYHRSVIDKDEYTTINRDISRILYDKVAFDGGLTDEESRQKWRTNAKDEVDKAVEATAAAKARRMPTPSESSSSTRRVPQVASRA